ncbi:hypothetical protein ACFL6Q_01280 [Candidatus Neomarinimicrobiota bacterium]
MTIAIPILVGIGVSGVGIVILLIIFLATIIITVLIVIIFSKLEHIPVDVIAKSGIEHYSCNYCSSDLLKEANSLTKPYYRHEYVPDSVVELWRTTNPKGFIQITDESGVLCASFGILALEQSFMKQFVQGRLSDTELEAKDILNFENSLKSSSLYISGVVVRDPNLPIGHRRACIMVWAMLEYFRKIYGPRKKRQVYALAVDDSSKNLLGKCGFIIAGQAANRKDKLNLYMLELTSVSANAIYSRIGEYSKMCDCNYTEVN